MSFAIDAFDVRGPINEKCHQLQSNKTKFIHYIQVVLYYVHAVYIISMSGYVSFISECALWVAISLTLPDQESAGHRLVCTLLLEITFVQLL